jgi:hypothetical protein
MNIECAAYPNNFPTCFLGIFQFVWQKLLQFPLALERCNTCYTSLHTMNHSHVKVICNWIWPCKILCIQEFKRLEWNNLTDIIKIFPAHFLTQTISGIFCHSFILLHHLSSVVVQLQTERCAIPIIPKRNTIPRCK